MSLRDGRPTEPAATHTFHGGKELTCPTCGALFVRNGIGRPKRFCSDDCRRQMAHLRAELSALERELTESKTLQAQNFGNRSHYWRGHVRHLELAIAELQSRVMGTPMSFTDDHRIVSALHEAGHAAVAWRLGRTLYEVTIRPEGAHLGYVTHSPEFVRSGDIPADLTIPIHGRVRDVYEVDGIILLAGKEAEKLFGQFKTGYHVDHDEQWVEQATQAWAEFAPRHRELVAAAARGEALSGDETNAMKASRTLAGDEATYHLGYMRAVSARLVAESAHLIEPLAHELLKTRVLSGTHATAIIAAHRRVTNVPHVA